MLWPKASPGAKPHYPALGGQTLQQGGNNIFLSPSSLKGLPLATCRGRFSCVKLDFWALGVYLASGELGGGDPR